jgi:serine/threonine-protein kinase RsbT
MNVIFYSDGGQITATITPTSIRLEVVDEGPGIADVEKAMQPGFSTAPDWVRELGFGAGMGLVNIRECADDMSLESTVGTGTRMVVDILLEARHDAQ